MVIDQQRQPSTRAYALWRFHLIQIVLRPGRCCGAPSRQARTTTSASRPPVCLAELE